MVDKKNLWVWPDSLLVIVISVLWGGIYLFVQTNGFYLPPSYQGDGLWYGMIAKNLSEGNPWAETLRLGAPFGQALWDFPYFYWIHIVLLKGLVLLFDNIFLALNAFVLISYGAVAFFSYFSFRVIGLDRRFAIVASVIFAGLPYHFMRHGGHMFLAAYFCIPIAFAAAYTVALSSERIRNKFLVISGVLCGGCGIYYIVIALWCMLFAIWIGIGKFKIRLRNSMLFLGTLFLSASANLIPHILYWLKEGYNPSAVVRQFNSIEHYELRVINLLLPQPSHILTLFHNLTDYYASNAYFVNENMSASLGILGGTGFILSLVILFRKAVKLDKKVVDSVDNFEWLAKFNLWILCFSIAGGVGTIISYYIGPYIRALCRFSIIIGLISLSILFLKLQYQLIRYRVSSRLIKIFLIVILGLAILDQTPTIDCHKKEEILKQFNSDRLFVKGIEEFLDDKKPILVLPYLEFPEGSTKDLKDPYTPLRLYIHSKKLHQSYGVTKGRLGDLWFRTLNELPRDQMLENIIASGFQGIILFDQTLRPLQEVSLEKELEKYLGNPTLQSAQKDISFYKLESTVGTVAPLVLKPYLTYGWYGWETNGMDHWAWSRGNAGLQIGHTFESKISLSFSATLFSLEPRQVSLYVDDTDKAIAQFDIGAQKKNISIHFEVSKGLHQIQFRTDQPATHPRDNKDRRLLTFAIANPTLARKLP